MAANWSIVCRMCLDEHQEMQSIFEEWFDIDLKKLIKGSLNLEITENDGLPHNICNGCIIRIKRIKDEKEFFVGNDEVLRNLLMTQYRQNEEQQEEIVFSEIEDMKMLNDEGTNILATEEIVETLIEAEDTVYEEEEYLVQNSPVMSDAETETPSPPTTPKQKKTNKRRSKNGQPLLNSEIPRLNDHKCYVCFEKFDSELDLHEHLGIHVKLLPYTCQECILETVVCSTLIAINKHKKMHHKPINCHFCDKSFISERSAVKHAEIYHLDSEKCRKSKNDIFQCDMCEKSYALKSSLKRHIANHLEKGRSSHQCLKCDKSYLSMHALKIHTEQHMNEKAVLNCDKCYKQFNSYRNLKAHLKTHSKAQESTSEYKPRTTPKLDVAEYINVEFDEKNQEIYRCTECEKISDDLKMMRTHVKTHIKVHNCSYCDKSFCRPSKKIDHERTHTGDKPHICEHCQKTFRTSSSLNKHLKVHDPEIDVPIPSTTQKQKQNTENSEKSLRIKSKEKTLICQYCENKFVYEHALKTHIKMFHFKLLK